MKPTVTMALDYCWNFSCAVDYNAGHPTKTIAPLEKPMQGIVGTKTAFYLEGTAKDARSAKAR